MKIINKSKNNVTINDINFGDVFLVGRACYMKIHRVCSENCVNLYDGNLVHILCDTIITPVKAAVVIEQA